MKCADMHRKMMFDRETGTKETFCYQLHEICRSAQNNHVSHPNLRGETVANMIFLCRSVHIYALQGIQAKDFTNRQ